MMNLDPKKQLFGETAFVNGREVVWDLSYKEARKAAISACEEHTLNHERDFFIIMEVNDKDKKMHFKNLIIKHSGCEKINNNLPPALQFDPASVEQWIGVDGGVCFVYRNSAQRVFTTGEASPLNCNISYLNATAEKRIFDRVVLRTSGLHIAGIYSEAESEEFKAPKVKFMEQHNIIPSNNTSQDMDMSGEQKNAPVHNTPVQNIYTPAVSQPMPEIPQMDYIPFSADPIPTDIPQDMDVSKEQSNIPFMPIQEQESPAEEKRKERIDEVKTKMVETLTNPDSVLNFYGKKNLEELSENELSDLENKLERKSNRKAAKTTPRKEESAGVSFADRVVTDAHKNAQPDLTPVPRETAPDPVPMGDLIGDYEEEEEEEAKPAIFRCSPSASEELLEMQGYTLEEIGYESLHKLFGRKNSKNRQNISPVMLAEIDIFLTAEKKRRKR